MIMKIIVIASLLPVLVKSFLTPTSLLNDNSCDSPKTFSVDSNKDHLVTWNGDQIYSICSMKFKYQYSNKNICIKALLYSVMDCSVNVSYYGGLSGDTLKESYTCVDYPTEYCGDTYHDVTIKVDARRVRTIGSSFRLRVYVKSVPHVTDPPDLSNGFPNLGAQDIPRRSDNGRSAGSWDNGRSAGSWDNGRSDTKDTAVSSDDDGISVSASAGGGTGTVVLIALIVVGIYFWKKHRHTIPTFNQASQQPTATVVNINPTQGYPTCNPTFVQPQPRYPW